MSSQEYLKAKKWAEDTYFDSQDRDQIHQLLESWPASENELKERFYKDLEFGTGGLRAPMGMGPNRMNKYNVRRATQALAENVKKLTKEGRAVISYDSRHCSKEFALEAALVFAANDIKTYLFHELTPTPILSYAIRELKAQTGIMITASHNPPIYNGFKAFWVDGAQVVPPVDQRIIDSYDSLNDWSKIQYVDLEKAQEKKLIEDVPNEIFEKFYHLISTDVIQDLALTQEHGHELSIVYTALHGTGQVPCMEILKRLGFSQSRCIEEQMNPDGNFSTVKSPNPEDPKALKLAVDEMLKIKADLVMGTDPDCDRLGAVINDHGTPFYLNGNQIGVLMIEYVLSRKQKQKRLTKDSVLLKSIVTSTMQNTIAKSFNVKVEETLTGFKWMAGKLNEWENKSHPFDFIFASEESFGYMPHCSSRDKDGVSSVALMSEIALYYKRQQLNLREALDKLYLQYGFFQESLLSFDYEGLQGSEKIKRIMENFRSQAQSFFTEKIARVEDYQLQVLKDLELMTEIKLDLPKSNVIGLEFTSGDKLYLRPSGTEPKIKFYTMIKSDSGSLEERKLKAKAKVNNIEEIISLICEKI